MTQNKYRLTRFEGIAAGVLLVIGAGLMATAGAQEYDFGYVPEDGVGNATTEIEISIVGRVLTAVIRNTSPNLDNYGGNSSLLSPTISGFGFDLVGSSGESLVLEDWTLTAYKNSGRVRVLSQADNPKWETSNTGDTFAFNTIMDKNGLYNPEASGGLMNSMKNAKFTEAVLQATFNDTVSLVGGGPGGDDAGGDSSGGGTTVVGGDPGTSGGTVNLVEDLPETFSPFVRFGYVGSAMEPQTSPIYATTSTGTGSTGGAGNHSPEPGSVLIWALGIATCVGMRRPNRPAQRGRPTRRV